MCPSNLYGSNCKKECKCQNGAKCNATTGSCTCKEGWQGTTCSDRICPFNLYGKDCEKTCECNMENTEM